jgi:hypothetical protein
VTVTVVTQTETAAAATATAGTVAETLALAGGYPADAAVPASSGLLFSWVEW